MKLGDNVKWSSTSNGITKTKTGVIVAVVPSYDKPDKHIEAATEQTGASFSSSAGPGMARNHESYVVHVQTKTGKGKGTLYWPKVRNLLMA